MRISSPSKHRRLTRALVCALLMGVAQPVLAEAKAPATATYDVLEREGVIQDRFGNDLKTYYYLPAKGVRVAPGRFPAILSMNYLGNNLSAHNVRDIKPVSEGGVGVYNDVRDARYFAARGFAFVSVDFPGRGSSSGWNTLDFTALSQSGYDAVEWLAGRRHDGSRSPDSAWSSGRIGMYGLSGNALVQLLVAQQNPPHLKALVPEVAPSDLYRDLFYPGAMRATTQFASVAGAYNGTATPCQDVPGTQREVQETVTCADRKSRNLQLVPTDMVDVVQHPHRDHYWQAKSVDLSKVAAPMWSLGTWDDFFTDGSTRLFVEGGSSQNLLTMGVGGHTIRNSFDYRAEVLPWFERWLKGTRNDIDRQLQTARFRYYVQRGDEWRAATDYPIPGTRYTPLNLGAPGPETPPLATGTLSSTTGGAGEAAFAYSPAQGATSGQYGTLRKTHPNRAGESAPRAATFVDPGNPYDQRAEAASTLQFLSPPLSSDTEVTGPVTAKLFASSTSADTDWVVHLVDVYPDDATPTEADPTPAGYRYKVTSGWLSGTHRNSLTFPEPIPVGKIVEYNLNLLPTSYLFKKGHRVGVVIASADSAHTEPNRSPAVNTVHFGGKHLSRVTLPVVPRTTTKAYPQRR